MKIINEVSGMSGCEIKRFWDGLLFCPLWTNYHSFLYNLLQPSYCAKFRGKKDTFLIIPLLLN